MPYIGNTIRTGLIKVNPVIIVEPEQVKYLTVYGPLSRDQVTGV